MQQSDIGSISDCHQGLPALRQVQAGVRHPRAARQPALQPAQQDPGDLAADRGVPVRGADAPRRVASGTGTSSPTSADHCTVCHKCASALPGRHRLRRRVDGDARPAAAHGQEALQSRHRRGHVLPQRDQSRDHPPGAQGDDRVGLQSCSAPAHGLLQSVARAQTRRPPATTGQAAAARAGDPLRQQARCRAACRRSTARALLDIENPRLRADHPRPGRDQQRHRGGVLFPGLRLGAAVLAGGPRHAGHAVARRRADGAAARLSVLRLSAARRRPVRPRARRSPPTTACCSTASPTR